MTSLVALEIDVSRECLVTNLANESSGDLSTAQGLKDGRAFAKFRMVNIDMPFPVLVAYKTERSSVAGYRALERSLVSLSVIISV